jgi:hypothetical protein
LQIAPFDSHASQFILIHTFVLVSIQFLGLLSQ